MTDILNRHTVLVINKVFQVIGITTPKKSFIAINSEKEGNIAAKPILVEYKQINENTWDFDEVINISALTFEEWLNIKILPYDSVVHTVNKIIKIPNVIQASNYSKIPIRQIKPTKRNIYNRYGGKCAYTNKPLTFSNSSIDHIYPKSRWKSDGKQGSPDNWENVCLADKEINSKKGNKLNSEAGLILLQKVSTPKPVPISALISEIRNNDWRIFLHK